MFEFESGCVLMTLKNGISAHIVAKTGKPARIIFRDGDVCITHLVCDEHENGVAELSPDQFVNSMVMAKNLKKKVVDNP